MSPDRITCEAFVRLLDSLASGAASWIEERRAAAHVHACGVCAATYSFELAVDRAIRARLATIEAPRNLRSRVEALLVSCTRTGNPDQWRKS